MWVDMKKRDNRFPLERVNGKLPALKAGDIVMIRHKKGELLRYFLREITHSYWDHTALVIFPKNEENGYSADIIVESIQHGLMTSLRPGVAIHRLEKYLLEPELYDVGIKRVSWLDAGMQDRIRSFVLMNLDSPYYPLSTIKLGYAFFSKRYRRILLHRQRFSCSGLIQKAFYEAADWSNRTKIVFRNVGYTPIQLQDITSPADISQSTACDWIWNEHP